MKPPYQDLLDRQRRGLVADKLVMLVLALSMSIGIAGLSPASGATRATTHPAAQTPCAAATVAGRVPSTRAAARRWIVN